MKGELALELRRQSLHTASGIASMLLIYYGIAGWKFFLLVVMAGSILSFASIYRKIPAIPYFLKNFDRKETIPGKGALLFFAGVTITAAFFEKDVALAGIAILTFADAISRMGQFFGKTHFPWNRHKQVESSLLALLGGAIAASFFVPANEALIASSIVMLIESFPINAKGRPIDDNLFIPVGGALIIHLLRGI